MKKWAVLVGLSAVLFSGCSLLEEANNTLTYASDMTEFLNDTQQFANDVSSILENAASDPNALQSLQAQFENMQQEIQSVEEMEVPAIAESIHGQLLSYSGELETSISSVLAELENGVFDPAVLLEGTGLMQTIEELQALRTNIEQLGQ